MVTLGRPDEVGSVPYITFKTLPSHDETLNGKQIMQPCLSVSLMVGL